MKKKLLIAGGIVLAALIAMFLFVTDGLVEGARVPINGIDISNISDGSYTGTYDFKRWTNTVAVHVEDNRITKIDILSDENAADAADTAGEMFRRVLEAQDTRVDTVSGATVTSKAYLKAIEDALELQPQR